MTKQLGKITIIPSYENQGRIHCECAKCKRRFYSNKESDRRKCPKCQHLQLPKVYGGSTTPPLDEILVQDYGESKYNRTLSDMRNCIAAMRELAWELDQYADGAANDTAREFFEKVSRDAEDIAHDVTGIITDKEHDWNETGD